MRVVRISPARLLIAFAVTVSMVASLLAATPGKASAADPWDAIKSLFEGPPGAMESTPGRPLKVKPDGPDPEDQPPPQFPKPRWPQASEATVDLSGVAKGATAQAPGSIVRVGRASDGQAPPGVRVATHHRKVSKNLGVDGPVFGLAPTTEGSKDDRMLITVDYGGFWHAHSGNFADRLHLVRLPGCALTTPAVEECRSQIKVPTRNDGKRRTLAADVPAEPAIYAVTAGTAGESGDYKATDLKQAGGWAVGEPSGSFGYSYPVQVPPSPYGPAPEVTLSYDSGSVDGRSSASNNQASWVGMGWEYHPGFIERRYKPCTEDGKPTVGDLCWDSPYKGKDDGAVYNISLNGRHTELLWDGDHYRMRDDQNWRIDHRFDGPLPGKQSEYWIVTTPDGTRYFFGYGRERHKTNGAATNSNWTVPVVGNDSGEPGGSSGTDMPYRWNLDYVIDPNENATVYYWETETNHYKSLADDRKIRSYVSGGVLKRIEYGLRPDHPGAQAPARVVFRTLNRCKERNGVEDPWETPPDQCPTVKSSPSSYPDIPTDQVCGSSSCDNYSPTFFLRDRLDRITTYVAELDGEGWDTAGVYQLKFAYPLTDDGSDRALWLNWIRRIGGTVGGGTDNWAKEAVTDFNGTNLNNRVDVSGSAEPLSMRRITTVQNTLGGDVHVTYGHQNKCSNWGSKDWARNSQDCYRVWFVPDGADDGRWGVFHKYLVKKVVEEDRVGGNPNQTTTYQYLYGAGWHFDDNLSAKLDHQSWSDWRGYKTVQAVKGTSADLSQRSATRNTYFRGLHNDRLNRANTEKRTETSTDFNGKEHTDHHYLENLPLQSRVGKLTDSGGISDETGTVHEYWNSGVTADGPGFHNAHMIREDKVTGRSSNADNSWRTTETARTFDKQGLPTKELDKGDLATSGDDTCTTTKYARNTSGFRWMLAYPSVVTLHKSTCDGGNQGQTVTLYDGADTLENNVPVDGNPTQVREYYNSISYASVTRRYDQMGRVVRETQPNGTESESDDTTTTVYDPEVGWPAKGMTTFRPPIDGRQLSTTSYLSRRDGAPVKTIDANDRVTLLDYDTLGRLTHLWLPTEPKPADGSEGTPSKKFTYSVYFNGIKAPYAPSRVTSQRWQDGPTTSPLWNTSYAYLDGFGREIESQTTTPFDAETGRLVSVTRYDNRGLKRFDTRVPIYNSSAAGAGVLNPDEQAISSRTVYTYDALARPVKAALWKGATELWRSTADYAANVTVVTPPSGGARATWTNALGQPTAIEENYNPSLPGAKTRYSYTVQGELASITDPNGNVSRYSYDWQGRRLQADDPDAGTDRDPGGGLTRYSYDLAGNLVSTTDGTGAKVSYSYDALNRRTGQFAGEVGSGERLASWSYDTAPGGKGEVAKAVRHLDGNDYITEIPGYDNGGRPTGSTVTIPEAEGALAGTYTTGFGYDRAGRQNKTTYPAAGRLDAETVTTRYSPKSGATKGLTSTWAGGMTLVKNTLYWGTGQIVERHSDIDGSLARRYEYEVGTGRLSQLLTINDDTETTLQHDTYGYDPAGNVTRITDKLAPAAGGGTKPQHQCLTYDNINRLQHAWTTTASGCSGGPDSADDQGPEPYKLSYVYRHNGNIDRVTDGETVHEYSYPAQGANAVRPHAVTKITTQAPNNGGGTTTAESTYRYDAAGQMTGRTVGGQTTTFDWDEVNRLTEAATGDKKTTFVYDADGNRLIRRDPDSTTLYLNGMELKATGDTVAATRYYDIGGTLIAMRDQYRTIWWLFNDPQASVSLAVDTANRRTQRQRYLPFGAHRGPDAIDITERGFLGKTEDPTTGLVATDERYYDPTIARFISPDPIINPANPQQINPYSYALNNPATFHDPSGLCPYGACLPPKKFKDHFGQTWDEKYPGGIPWETPSAKARRSVAHRCYINPTVCIEAGIMPPPQMPSIPPDFWGTQRDGAIAFAKLFCQVPVGPIGAGICAGGSIADYAVNTDNPSIEDAVDAVAMDLIGSKLALLGKVAGWLAGTGARNKPSPPKPSRPDRPSMPLEKVGGKKTADPPKPRKSNRSTRSGCSSFVPGTTVVMADGTTKPIQDVEIGDKVLATDPATGKTTAQPVIATITGNGTKHLVKITVDGDGAPNTDWKDHGAPVLATAEHPFWVANLNRWVPAGQLQPGMWLRTSSGTFVQVAAVRKQTTDQRVHNLTISGPHTYHVGLAGLGLLVHNDQCRNAKGQYTSGENPDAKRGRQTHVNYRTALGSNYDFKVKFPSGNKPDAVDWDNRVVRELKSDAPSSIRGGRRQLQGYVDELEAMTGEQWTGYLDIYRR